MRLGLHFWYSAIVRTRGGRGLRLGVTASSSRFHGTSETPNAYCTHVFKVLRWFCMLVGRASDSMLNAWLLFIHSSALGLGNTWSFNIINKGIATSNKINKGIVRSFHSVHSIAPRDTPPSGSGVFLEWTCTPIQWTLGRCKGSIQISMIRRTF